jgi:hypothetical protein
MNELSEWANEFLPDFTVLSLAACIAVSGIAAVHTSYY